MVYDHSNPSRMSAILLQGGSKLTPANHVCLSVLTYLLTGTRCERRNSFVVELRFNNSGGLANILRLAAVPTAPGSSNSGRLCSAAALNLSAVSIQSNTDAAAAIAVGSMVHVSV